MATYLHRFLLFSFLSASFILLPFPLSAQDNCATDEVHQHRLDTDPAYRAHVQQMQAQVKQIIDNMPDRNTGTGLGQNEIYTIPVVVHIIHLGEAVGTGNNISDAQVLGAINGLNDRFRNVIGASFDIEMQFCLATQDPDGCYTTGINRVDGSGIPNYSARGIMRPGDNCNGASDVAIKNLSRWPVSRYYNIWVVRAICGGWAGYAYYPNGNAYDGTVIARAFFNYNNTTLTHELGHGWFIYHTFEGDGDGATCPLNNNCNNNGDRICDTPPHRRNDCGNSNPCTDEGIWTNSRRNYMSYCSNKDRFTQGQKDRMLATMQVWPRSQLLNSPGCTPSDFNTFVRTTHISCHSLCDGSITVTPNCSGDYTYLWDTGETTPTISGLCAGDYEVTVTHSSGYAVSFTARINEPTVLSATLQSASDATCFGFSDGSATISVSGGTGTPSVSWSNGQSGPSATGLPAGDYTATVTDTRNCVATVEVSINEPSAPPAPTITVLGPTTFCPGDSVQMSSSPASGYLWTNGATTQTATILTAGSVSVTTFDADGCPSTSEAVEVALLPAPPVPVISATGNVLNSDAPTGNQWYLNGEAIQGAIFPNFTPTVSGNYTVSVTGDNGCSTFSAPFFFTLTSTFDPLANQEIKVSPNPGTGRFQLETGKLLTDKIVVYNMLGKEILRIEGHTDLVDISGYPAGTYHLLIHTREGVFNRKLVLQ